MLELALELHREHRLLHLADDAALRGEVDVLDVLLGDRGAALGGAGAADVVVEGPADADGVDAAVLEEVAVLGGEHRVLEHVGDLVELDVGAVLLGAEGGDGVVGAAGLGDVGGADERGLQQRLLGRELDVEHHRRDAAGGRHEHEPDHEEAAPPAPQEAAIAARAGGASARHRRGGALAGRGLRAGGRAASGRGPLGGATRRHAGRAAGRIPAGGRAYRRPSRMRPAAPERLSRCRGGTSWRGGSTSTTGTPRRRRRRAASGPSPAWPARPWW